MRRKLLTCLLLAALLIAVCQGCSHTDATSPAYTVPVLTDTCPEADRQDAGIRIVQITDPHYYSPALTDKGSLYQSVMASAGGRDALHTEDILESFYQAMATELPDIIIVSGDLTMNGERQSHLDFAAYLGRLKALGIEVLVIPGNHDINSESSYAIYDSGAVRTDNISPEDFEEIYADFGYADAVSRDENSLSYVYEYQNLTLIMLDTCIYRNYVDIAGNLTYESRKWVYSCVDDANSRGQTTVTVSHHNLLSHNELFTADYTLINNARFVEELMARGVRLNLSGHLHCMNIADQNESFYDIALSCLTVWPCSYGQLDIEKDGSMLYTTHSVENDTASYAYSYGCLYDAGPSVNSASLSEQGFSAADIELMSDFAARLNAEYFAGQLEDPDILRSDPAYGLWMQLQDVSSTAAYLDEIVSCSRRDHTWLLIDRK